MVKEISCYLADYMGEHHIAGYAVESFSNGLALLEGGGFDVFFLDIRMEQPDGMETARRLRERGDQSLLVFVTVLKDCVFDAFEVEAYDYLLKPLDVSHFKRTMDRALRRLARRTARSVMVRRGTGCEVVMLADIMYCEVLDRKIYIHKQDGTVIDYYGRLEELERRVDGRFFKSHRSYLVNLDYVRGCRARQVMLPGEEVVPVSRLRERELTQALLRYMMGKDGL